jgi:hypothetical protein
MDQNPCDDLAEYMRKHGKRKEINDEHRLHRIKGAVIVIGFAILSTFIIVNTI